MPDDKPAVPVPADAAAVKPAGVTTFLLLCGRARVNRRMANALRVVMKRKRSEINTPCDEAEFKKALAALRPEHG